MKAKKQYEMSFEEFMTQDGLDRCTEDDREKLDHIYTVITDNIKAHESDNWNIDRDTFRRAITDPDDEFYEPYVTLEDRVDEYTMASVQVYRTVVSFGDGGILNADDLKFITDTQRDLNDLENNRQRL